MSFDFPTEVVEEGNVSAVVPRLEHFVKAPWEYAPSKAPVFYNPVMEFNRDLAVLALQVYQKRVGKQISLCEPLAGCGVRGIRFAVEVEGVRKVVMNDINPEAAKLARFNAERNKLENRVSVENEDANLLLSRYAAPRKRFDFIDVDPFGSPAPYLDSTVRCLRKGGLLALTATDLAPLCGVHPKACVRKYGGKPLRTEYCHELAVRLLIGSLAKSAAKHHFGLKVVFSHSTNHYIRAYAVMEYGSRKADSSVEKMGYVLHCFNCLHRETSEGVFSGFNKRCPECGGVMSVAGPLWLGEILDKKYCMLMENELGGRKLRQTTRISKLLSQAENEAEGLTTYYVMDRICDKLNIPVPPVKKVVNELKKAGFHAVRTHFNSTGVRTDASAKQIKSIVASL
ncbi:MAG: tRNA (guanine(10)-N(2))-dimethyltransferase [Thermoproteota archaeon]|nr:tRNA (guanine(10)-N(2))-dimethyltransferase [Thermoproteota archaeon]